MAKLKATNRTPKNSDNTNEKHPKKLSKRTVIIIVSVCLALVLIGSIIGVIVATARRYNMWTENIVTYNYHENIHIIETDPTINVAGQQGYYSNGTAIVQNNANNLYGVYSYSDQKQIIGYEYTSSNIEAIELKSFENGNTIGTEKHIFKALSKGETDTKELTFFDDKGHKLSITEYNKDEDKLYGHIKERDIDVTLRNGSTKVKDNKYYKSKKIEIDSAIYQYSFIKNGYYNYEVWTLTDTNGNKYHNIYSVSGSSRDLRQTIGNPIGTKPETNQVNNMQPFFLKDGNFGFATTDVISTDNGSQIIVTNIYNNNFDCKNTVEIILDSYASSIQQFKVGDFAYLQYTYPCSENKYDFSKTIGGETTYYRLETYKLNLKNGKYTNINFNYLIENTNSSFNPEVAQLEVRKIKSKQLEDTEFILVNEKIQVKEVDYKIDTITKITNDRYLVQNEDSYYLIDKKFNKVAYLGEFNSYFTTKESIILKDTSTGYSYVCTLDGIVIKKYLSQEIINAYDDTYYIVKTTSEKDGVVYHEKYLERLGMRNKTPLHSIAEGENTYTYRNKTYCGYSDSMISQGISIITRIRPVDNTYTYEFYNIDGDLLLQIDQFDSDSRSLYSLYSQQDDILLYIAVKGNISYTMLLDR